MNKLSKKIIKYFTPVEWVLWLGGIAAIIIGFIVGEEKNYLSLASSILGVTCIMFNAKGSVWGQFIAIGFAVTYAILAYTKNYYGEMIIYLALMLPIHISSIVIWLKNKSDNSERLEVKINTLSKKEYIIAAVIACALCVAFYFALRALGTDNLIISTISLITSLAAAYLMLRRCEYFAICFVLNDVILIALWSLKLYSDGISVLPSVMSFVIFLANDSYSFYSWKKIKRRQECARQSRA
jgi:nicotinamide mononucleotide transporter PnuC